MPLRVIESSREASPRTLPNLREPVTTVFIKLRLQRLAVRLIHNVSWLHNTYREDPGHIIEALTNGPIPKSGPILKSEAARVNVIASHCQCRSA